MTSQRNITAGSMTSFDPGSATPPMHTADDLIAIEKAHGVPKNEPPPMVIARARGSWVQDVQGNRYLDVFASRGALNHGHRHPAIVAAFKAQADRVTLTTRSYHHDQLGPFLAKLTGLTGFDVALPLITGAEAVQMAMRAARAWAAANKDVEAGNAEVIMVAGSTHERLVNSQSYGLSGTGSVSIPFGNVDALESAITDNTAAFFVETIQVESGVILPPPSYFDRVRSVCSQHNILLCLDEIQTGLGRTGCLFSYERHGIRPDCVLVGKALGGGVMPVSAVLTNRDVIDGLHPCEYESAFGGNPMSSAVAAAAIDVVVNEGLCRRAEEIGTWLMESLQELDTPHVVDVRGAGLLVGIEISADAGPARDVCNALLDKGILCRELHPQVVGFTPALTIDQDDLEWCLGRLKEVLQ